MAGEGPRGTRIQTRDTDTTQTTGDGHFWGMGMGMGMGMGEEGGRWLLLVVLSVLVVRARGSGFGFGFGEVLPFSCACFHQHRSCTHHGHFRNETQAKRMTADTSTHTTLTHTIHSARATIH